MIAAARHVGCNPAVLKIRLVVKLIFQDTAAFQSRRAAVPICFGGINFTSHRDEIIFQTLLNSQHKRFIIELVRIINEGVGQVSRAGYAAILYRERRVCAVEDIGI